MRYDGEKKDSLFYLLHGGSERCPGVFFLPSGISFVLDFMLVFILRRFEAI